MARDGLLQTSGGGAYAEQAKGHARLLAAADTSSLASPPTVVAKTVVRAVGARRPKTRYATGGGARTILFLRTILPDRMFDRLMRRISQGFG
jgi:hypothetical protein